MTIVPFGGAPPDALLDFVGTDTFLADVTADVYTDYVYVGEDRLFGARLLVAGAVSGTNPTLDVSFQDSADGITVSNTALASFAQQTADQVAAHGGVTGPPRIAVRTRNGFPYLRVYYNIGGTNSPTFNGVSVGVDPVLSAAP